MHKNFINYRENRVKTQKQMREKLSFHDFSRKMRLFSRKLRVSLWSDQKRKLVTIASFIVVIGAFYMLSASAAVTVDTSTNSSATAYSFQRKTWHDGTRHWVAFQSGTQIEFWYSTNGTSWTQNTNATIGVSLNDFTIEADNSNAFCLIADTGSGYAIIHDALNYPGVSFSWTSGDQALDPDQGGSIRDISLNRDTSNRIHASGNDYDAFANTNKLKWSISNYANNTTGWPSSTVIRDSGSTNIWANYIVPIAAEEMYATWVENTSIFGKKYTISNTSTGPNNPASSANDTGGVWNLTNQVYSSNDSYASANIGLGGDSGYLKASNFSFNIPTNATIKGIEVGVESNSTGGGEITQTVDVYKNNILGAGSTLSGVWPVTTDAYINYGGSTSLWGESWAPIEINSVNFGVGVMGQEEGISSATLNIDHIRITVHYSVGTWDASATSIGTVTSGAQYAPSMVSNTTADEAYMTYVNGSGQTTFQKYIDGTGWQTAVTLDSNSGNAYPTITRNTSNGDLHAFWIRGNTVYYKKGVSPYGVGNWDSNATTFESTGTNTWTTSGESHAGDPFAIWTEGTGSPYNVRFGKVSANSTPPAPTLLTPTNNDTGLSTTPQFQLSSTDADGDYLRYEIIVYQSDCTTVIRTIDQTASQTGWSGQNSQTNTAYTSGTTAIHNYQTPELPSGSNYCWKARAIDPGGSNTWSSYSATRSFSTVVVFPTTGILDNFNRTNEGPLGTSSSGDVWNSSAIFSGTCRLRIISNQAEAQTSCTDYSQYLSTNNYGPNAASYVTLKSLQANDTRTVSLYNRLSSEGTTNAKGYKIAVMANKIEVHRVHSSSTSVLLSTLTKTTVANDAVGFVVKGASSPVSIEVWHKPSGNPWALVGTVSDNFSITPPGDTAPYLASGKLGLELFEDAGGNTSIVDDFGGGTFNNPPVQVSLSSPSNNATGVSKTPQFQVTTTDSESNNLQYQIIVYQSDCSTIVRTIDQTSSQTGWTGQNANGDTTYTSGTTATHSYQLPTLESSTTYCWRSRAVDPAGSNTYGSYSTARSFTTTAGSSPGGSELIYPASNATGIRGYPTFRLRASDADYDYLQYKIEICTTNDCSVIARTIDQTTSQVGWGGQNANGNTAYTSDPNSNNSTIAYYLLQPPALAANTQYWWRAYSIDPGGSNIWSSASSIQTFTTTGVTNVEIRGGSNIQGGGWIY